MPTTGLVASRAFLSHDTGRGHPECAARLEVIERHLAATGLAAEVASQLNN